MKGLTCMMAEKVQLRRAGALVALLRPSPLRCGRTEAGAAPGRWGPCVVPPAIAQLSDLRVLQPPILIAEPTTS